MHKFSPCKLSVIQTKEFDRSDLEVFFHCVSCHMFCQIHCKYYYSQLIIVENISVVKVSNSLPMSEPAGQEDIGPINVPIMMSMK